MIPRASAQVLPGRLGIVPGGKAPPPSLMLAGVAGQSPRFSSCPNPLNPTGSAPTDSRIWQIPRVRGVAPSAAEQLPILYGTVAISPRPVNPPIPGPLPWPAASRWHQSLVCNPRERYLLGGISINGGDRRSHPPKPGLLSGPSPQDVDESRCPRGSKFFVIVEKGPQRRLGFSSVLRWSPKLLLLQLSLV